MRGAEIRLNPDSVSSDLSISTFWKPNCVERKSASRSSVENPRRISSWIRLDPFSRSFPNASLSCSRVTIPPRTKTSPKRASMKGSGNKNQHYPKNALFCQFPLLGAGYSKGALGQLFEINTLIINNANWLPPALQNSLSRRQLSNGNPI